MTTTIKLTGRSTYQITELRRFVDASFGRYELTDIKQTAATFTHSWDIDTPWAVLHDDLVQWKAGLATTGQLNRGEASAISSLIRYTAKNAKLEADPEHQQLVAMVAEKKNTDRALAKAKRTEQAKQERRAAGSPCQCGCDGTTAGGRYLPGHDARHKSQLIKAALAGSDDAAAQLKERNWTKFLDKAREMAARPKTEPRQKRTEDDEQRAKEKLERLALMKTAAELLKTQGRYERSADGYVEVTAENAQQIIDGEV